MNKPLTGRRILIVEDEMLILMLLEDMLEELGCISTVAAATGEAALAHLSGQTFDAVLLDMNLDGKSSHPVAQALARSGIPFIYSTGSSVSEIEEGFKDRPLLSKPYSCEHLARAFAGLLHS
jgi:CheY-like chemotaxis protein